MIQELQELKLPSDIERYGDCRMRCGNKTILEFFLECVANGTSPRMAEVFAMQQAPGIGITDTVYIADQNRHGRSILERMNNNTTAVEVLRRNLAKRGYKLQSDDHYIETVARFPGDPMAIVNHKQTLGDLKRRIASEGKGVRDGAINIKADNGRPPVNTKKYRLHPRLVREIDQKNMKANPDLCRVPVRERYESIVEKHGGTAKVKD